MAQNSATRRLTAGQQRKEARDAEREALQLMENRIPLIGSLRLAAVARNDAASALDAAAVRTRELVEEARQRGAALVAEARRQGALLEEDAQRQAGEAEAAYAEAFDAAAAAWTEPTLLDLQYALPVRAPRKRAKPARRVPEQRGPAPAEDVVVEVHAPQVGLTSWGQSQGAAVE
ncbi:hypothetical protein Lfu02_15020 [Longispora fulva]|uniref:Uncharacterized protein n=1 Tax=Longispora fulva TaxID=619741 RepID=A0A8J7H2L8_9ACTN|nr:hypothetical protein [Longispora fulva]MBG6140488.1 hypothetical protein [Longispora fulva]GIG57130.1 hypothetical protein Lfu02_15020 [Longispora fulva]